VNALRSLLAFATLIGIAVVVLWESEERTSPGPLHPVHARITELRGDCEACHGDGEPGAMSAACGDCHTSIRDQIAARRGLHGQLAEAANCGSCHGEHHGEALAPVGPAAFREAGVDDVDGYRHEHVADFGLIGAHASLACTSCHEHAEVEILAQGTQRFLGLEQTCASCHEDVHSGDYGQDCASCHGQQEKFETVAAFQHQRFEIDGAHRGVGCTDCHQPDSPNSVAARIGTDPAPRRCVDCHGPAHAPGGTALPLATPAAAMDCAACHDAAGFPRDFGADEHRSAGYPLDGAHAEAACATCHTEERAREPLRGEPMDRCTDCHGRPHGPSGDALPLAHRADDCARCHTPEAAFQRGFGVEEHLTAGVRLDGKHAAASCASCHDAARRDAEIDRETDPMARCADCHPSPHRDAFTAAVVALAAVPEQNCAVCHESADADFHIERLAPGAHAAAGFDLVRPHDDVACQACHGDAATPFDERFPGRVPDRCGACHEDPHSGQFDGGRTGGDCLACHAREAFRPSAIDADRHGADDGFALTGAHRAVACARCHEPTPAAPETVRYAGVPDRCVDCHQDPHGGTFDRDDLPAVVDGRPDCARCHTTEGFRAMQTDFDHGTWTGHALLGSHAQAACTACHGRTAAPDTLGRSLGKAPQDCAACHDDPHLGQFARLDLEGARRTDCARCHDEAAAFESLRFDHGRDSRFALDATHSALACDACHKPQPIGDGRSVIRYRPLGVQCADCHGGREEVGRR
jgi:hypothetical protein